MSPLLTLDLSPGRTLAYHRLRAQGDGANAPGIVFLGGFKSSMAGEKGCFLHGWAAGRGRAFVRFDYTGHGASSGRFEELAISDWAGDAAEVLARLTEGPQILVGSSMGGWIALLLARRFPDRVAGLVGIAAAPDFTEDGLWARMTGVQQRQLMNEGRIEVPSAHDDGPYVITRRLIEDGRGCLVLRSALPVHCPVRLLHGTADEDVPMDVALRLLGHLEGGDVRLTLLRGSGHRLSGPRELHLLGETLDGITRTILSDGAR